MESLEVARTLIAEHSHDMILSNLSLNAFVYFAHVESLRTYKKPLISDSIQAWRSGPIEPIVYRNFEKYSLSLIPESEGKASANLFVKKVLDDLYREYGFMTPYDLIQYWSRPGSAWSTVYDPNKKKEITIPNILSSRDVHDYPKREGSLGASLQEVNKRFSNTLRLLEDA